MTLAFYLFCQAFESGLVRKIVRPAQFLFLDVLDGDWIVLFRLDISEEPHMPLFVTFF